MQKYILDTNLFFNMEAGLDLGDKTEEVVKTLTQAAITLKSEQKASFYMPPRIVDEFLSFFDDKTQPFLQEFLSHMVVKSPDMHNVNLPAPVFYDLVEDIRNRSYRGLTVGEEEIQEAAKTMMGKADLSKKDFEISVGHVVKHFRLRYRQATRVGFLDSLGDLDIIMLAKELDGTVVSTDEGVMTWARKFGVKEISPSSFGQMIRSTK